MHVDGKPDKLLQGICLPLELFLILRNNEPSHLVDDAGVEAHLQGVLATCDNSR